MVSLDIWRERIARWGLETWVEMGLDLFEPLSPLVGQILWVLQPTLGLVLEPEQVSNWAKFLEDPQGVAWLREELVKHE